MPLGAIGRLILDALSLIGLVLFFGVPIHFIWYLIHYG